MSELQHLIFFLERTIHVASMAFMFGGTVLLWILASRSRALDDAEHQLTRHHVTFSITEDVMSRQRLLQFAAEKYEFFFWIAIGIQVITGIGNLASFATALPDTSSAWGIKLTLKLTLVLLLILLSLVRTVLVARLNMLGFDAARLRLPQLFEMIYGSTTLILLAVVILAEALAHG